MALNPPPTPPTPLPTSEINENGFLSLDLTNQPVGVLGRDVIVPPEIQVSVCPHEHLLNKKFAGAHSHEQPTDRLARSVTVSETGRSELAPESAEKSLRIALPY